MSIFLKPKKNNYENDYTRNVQDLNSFTQTKRYDDIAKVSHKQTVLFSYNGNYSHLNNQGNYDSYITNYNPKTTNKQLVSEDPKNYRNAPKARVFESLGKNLYSVEEAKPNTTHGEIPNIRLNFGEKFEHTNYSNVIIGKANIGRFNDKNCDTSQISNSRIERDLITGQLNQNPFYFRGVFGKNPF
jgi:hypothetical protein